MITRTSSGPTAADERQAALVNAIGDLIEVESGLPISNAHKIAGDVLAFLDQEAERLDAEAEEYARQQIARTMLGGLDIADGAVTVRMAPPHDLVAAIATELARSLGEAPNYTETDFSPQVETASLDVHAAGDREWYVLTVQRKHGKTPHQLRPEAEAERDQARAKIEHLTAANHRLAMRNAEQQQIIEQQAAAIEQLRTPPWRLFGCTPDDLRAVPLDRARTLRAILQQMADSDRMLPAAEAAGCAEAAHILDERLNDRIGEPSEAGESHG